MRHGLAVMTYMHKSKRALKLTMCPSSSVPASDKSRISDRNPGIGLMAQVHDHAEKQIRKEIHFELANLYKTGLGIISNIIC